MLHDTHGMMKERVEQGIERTEHSAAKETIKKLKDNLWIGKNICKPYIW